jgi:hypothetical protein
VAAGVGIVTLALVPLAIPIFALTAVALISAASDFRAGIDGGAVPAAPTVVPPGGCPVPVKAETT